MGARPTGGMRRRELFAGVAALALSAHTAEARVVRGGLPWKPGAGEPPVIVRPGPWQYLTAEEGAAIEAMVDRLIPADDLSPGGRDLGCAIYIDRQLAGPYGSSRGLYMRPPFIESDPKLGPQSPVTPKQRYRDALAAVDRHVRAASAGKPFAQLPDDQKDKLLAGLEKGDVKLDGTSGTAFFAMLLKNTQEGFLADPVYGGNRDMAGWRMIGFPGARYDYRDWVLRHNERYPLPPVGISGRPEWTPKG